jgi:glycosyltransferase involved in cell wall biosynthesis
MSKVGGTEVATYITAKELQSYVDYIGVFGKKGPLSQKILELDIDQVEGDAHTKNPLKIIKYIYDIKKLINDHDIDIVHAQMARPIPFVWIAKTLSKNKQLKIFWTSRGLKHRTYKYLVPALNKINIKALGNCKLEQEKLIRYGFKAANTGFVYNPYRLNPKTAVREKTRKRAITIGTLSALREDRCVDLFIEIAKEIMNSNFQDYEFEFLIGGNGNYKTALENISIKYGISNSVNFLGNIDDVEAFMQKIDIFVSPIVVKGDSGAGVSNAIVEAMVTKTPVCAYSAAAIGEIVINGQTGYLIEPQNIKKMVKAIIDTIENDALTQAYVNNAYDLIIKECNPKNYVSKLLRLYKEL